MFQLNKWTVDTNSALQVLHTKHTNMLESWKRKVDNGDLTDAVPSTAKTKPADQKPNATYRHCPQ